MGLEGENSKVMITGDIGSLGCLCSACLGVWLCFELLHLV